MENNKNKIKNNENELANSDSEKDKKNEQPQKKGWMDLLKNYVKDGPKKTKYQREEETTKLFLEILNSDRKTDNNSIRPYLSLSNWRKIEGLKYSEKS